MSIIYPGFREPSCCWGKVGGSSQRQAKHLLSSINITTKTKIEKMRLPWVWQSNFGGHHWLVPACRWEACSDSMASFWCASMTLSVGEEELMLGGRLHGEPWPEFQPSSSTNQENFSGWLCWGESVLCIPLCHYWLGPSSYQQASGILGKATHSHTLSMLW